MKLWAGEKADYPPPALPEFDWKYFRYSKLVAGGAGARAEDGRPEQVFSVVRLKLWAIIVDRVSTELTGLTLI